VIVQYLVAGACLLVVLSLPIAKTALGAALRRWGCFLFLLAVLPSVFFGLLRQTVRSQTPWNVGRVLEEAVTVLVVTAIAYGVLAWRKRAAAEKKAAKRIPMKQPVDPPGTRPDLLNLLRDQLRNDEGSEPERGE
jgi:hypothetical protein